MQAIALTIPRRRTCVAGDRYSIYGNGGNGPVDFNGPPLAADVPFWPRTRAHAGHLNEPHLGWGHLDHAVQDGHLAGRHLFDGHLLPEAVLRFVTPLYTIGHFVLAVRTMDAAGNHGPGEAAIVAVTVNSSPRPAADFAKAGYDEDTGRMVFSFEPSPDLAAGPR
jgi:hypothetical protein